MLVERVTRRGLLFLLALFLILTALLVSVVLPFLAYVFFGAFAAFLVWPLHVRLRRRMRARFSAYLITTGVYAVIFVPLTMLVWSIVRDLTVLLGNLRSDGAESILRPFVEGILPPDLAERALTYLVTALEEAAQRLAPQLVGQFLDAIIGTFIFGFVLYYCLLEGEALVAFTRGLMPLRNYRISKLFDQIASALNAVFFGVMIVAAVQGVAAGIVWWIAGLPNPFFYGAVMFGLAILPFGGPVILLLPVAIWHFAQGEIGMGIFIAVSGVILVGTIDNVMRPFLVGKFGHINPALVVVGLAGGLVAFGIVGVVLGPLIFALWVAVGRELRAEMRYWKDMSLEEGAPTLADQGAAAEA